MMVKVKKNIKLWHLEKRIAELDAKILASSGLSVAEFDQLTRERNWLYAKRVVIENPVHLQRERVRYKTVEGLFKNNLRVI